MTASGRPARRSSGGSSAPPADARPSRPAKVASAPPPWAPGRKPRRLRKDEIVVEATRLFAERGYDGASMGDVAESVGLRKASLFHHFASKDVLYAAVVEELIESIKAAIVGAATAEGSYAERLDRLTDALTNTLGSQPHAARLLVRDVMEGSPGTRPGLGRAVDDVLEAALEFAKAGQRDGAFDPQLDPAHLIVSLVGAHVLPFAMGEVVERFTGAAPFGASFIAARRVAIRMQVRALVLAKGSPK